MKRLFSWTGGPVALGAGLFVVLWMVGLDMSRAMAENLPVPIDRYVDACRKTSGGVSTYTNDGARLVSCKWTSHGKTECLLETDVVQRCVIACTSAVCLAENPSSANPKWPLNGGPKRLPTKAPTTGTNAPAN